MRFRILELLIVVAILAFAMASLQRSDPLFESLFFSFTLLVILAAFLLSIGRRAGARAFWIAFAATSSLYLIFAHVPDSEGSVPRSNGPEVTTLVLRRSFDSWHSEAYDTDAPPQSRGFYPVQDVPFGSHDYWEELASFVRVGQSAWALLFGWIAGHFTRFIYERSRREPT